METWPRGLRRHPAKMESGATWTEGSNPSVSANKARLASGQKEQRRNGNSLAPVAQWQSTPLVRERSRVRSALGAPFTEAWLSLV